MHRALEHWLNGRFSTASALSRQFSYAYVLGAFLAAGYSQQNARIISDFLHGKGKQQWAVDAEKREMEAFQAL